MISEYAIRQLKAAVPLLQEVRARGVELRRSGPAWVGLCLFHRESTPSMIVHGRDDGDFFKCFGCDAKGDVIDFFALSEGIPKIQAIRRLAEAYGISLDDPKRRRPEAVYLAETREHAEFWWAEQRAMITSVLENACTDFFAASAASADANAEGQWAASCGRILRYFDHLSPEDRGQIFLRLRTEVDVRRWRASTSALQRLNDAVNYQSHKDPDGFVAMIDSWAQRTM